MRDVFINPFTDFGFKKLFGEEPHKDLLISFLNSLLPEKHQIQDLSYSKNEYQGVSSLDRKAVFDLNCISHSGERFIVELQRVKQTFFKDRSIYYSTFAVQEQAKRGEWNYRLEAIYTVGILDFLIDDPKDRVVYHAQLKDQDNDLFYDKLNFIYLVLPRFNRPLSRDMTAQEKWLYVFRHLHELESMPAELYEEVFFHLFQIAQIAQIARFPPEERSFYEHSLKEYRDYQNGQDTAREEGRQEGMAEGLELGKQLGLEEGELQGKQKAAQRMLAKGMNAEMVAELVELPIELVRQL